MNMKIYVGLGLDFECTPFSEIVLLMKKKSCGLGLGDVRTLEGW